MKNVGLYCAWDEPFGRLLERMSWSTPDLHGSHYKDMRFVPPSYTHDYALVFNATELPVFCSPDHIFVIIFEPPEILGEDNPWLSAEKHPQAGGIISSFCTGSEHQLALGLHLPQSTIAPRGYKPSAKVLPCSMICSDKTQTPYHRKRLDIMHILMEEYDARIFFFGRGMRFNSNDPRLCGELPTQDKVAALRPYTFTIDFENTDRLALTDKFIDPILNATVPITNSRAAAMLLPDNSYEYIDFALDNYEIAERILEIITQPVAALERYDIPVLDARYQFTRGDLNICEWMYRKVNRL